MEGNVYRGKADYERWLREELPEVWEDFPGEDLEFRELPDGRVLLLGFIHSRGRASGAEVRVVFGQLAQFRDGQVVRLDAYPDHASALEAAGLLELVAGTVWMACHRRIGSSRHGRSGWIWDRS
jgi:ketosteroid isomerase-like protein